jgi:hypothetical protein
MFVGSVDEDRWEFGGLFRGGEIRVILMAGEV